MTPVSYIGKADKNGSWDAMLEENNREAIASAFVAARRSGLALGTYPGEAPTTMTQAYAIQDLALALDGRQVIGWKVGRVNAPLDAQLGTNRLAGPIFADAVFADGDGAPVFVDGFIAGESELMLHVATGFTGAVPSDDTGTKAIIDEVRLGIEVASSPYAGINADGPCVTASDFGNNSALVLGPRLEGWQDVDLCAIHVTTFIDGAQIASGTAATMLDGPYGAVRFLLANLAQRGFDVSQGLWISTGAITGVHQAETGQTVMARFGDFGEVTCHLVAAAAK
jgi:2-keto-4-pentenoate hydratase